MRGSMTPINLPRAGEGQWHYHTNTPFSVSQSGRGAFTAPHELESIKEGGCRLKGTLLPFGFTLRENSLNALPRFLWNIFIIFIMTLEEVLIQKPTERAQCTGKALEEVLVSAKDNDSITVGVYECAKVMNL